MLTQARLKELLSYDPETGLFTWITGPRRGKVAGCVNTDGYRVIRVDYILYYGHRLACLYMRGTWPEEDTDHINNRVRSDNRWDNLREATRSQNLSNKGKSLYNTSGYKGVSFCKFTGRWRAQLSVQGKGINIGRFDNPESAYAAYVIASKKYCGEFSRVE